MAGAIYYDGLTARRRVVNLLITASAVDIDEEGEWLASWPTGSVRRKAAADGILRLTLEGGQPLARLDIDDPDDRAAVLLHCQRLEIEQDKEKIGRIVLWSLLACASIVLTVLFLLPVVAERLTPLVPTFMEKRLGQAADNQVKRILSSKICSSPKGLMALGKLETRLQEGNDLGKGAEISVLDSRIANAIALPGGRIYLFDGLLNRADSVDEIAGVLAHEIGHVHARDSLRKLIQAGGTSYLLGLLLGDVTGGGSLIFVTRALMENAHSRDLERAADAFAARTMLTLGRSPSAMAQLLKRLDKPDIEIPAMLSSHPVTDERLESLARQAPTRLGEPLLSEEEWRALKEICMTE